MEGPQCGRWKASHDREHWWLEASGGGMAQHSLRSPKRNGMIRNEAAPANFADSALLNVKEARDGCVAAIDNEMEMTWSVLL